VPQRLRYGSRGRNSRWSAAQLRRFGALVAAACLATQDVGIVSAAVVTPTSAQPAPQYAAGTDTTTAASPIPYVSTSEQGANGSVGAITDVSVHRRPTFAPVAPPQVGEW